MRHNQICYYVERGFEGKLYVSYGMYEHESMYGNHTVSRLRPPEIRLINGIPFEEFQSETEFKKLPKGWTYSTDLYTVTENLDKKEKINATIVEDTMWERWIRDDDGRLIDGRESDDDGFKKFMLDNKDEVYELIELAMESEEQIRN